MNSKPLLAGLLAALIASAVPAQTPPQPDVASPVAAGVMATLRSTYVNTSFASVRETPVAGIFEVVMGKDVAYTDRSGKYFFFGNLMAMDNQRNLTAERRAQLMSADVSQFRLADAIKIVKGSGTRVLYVFSDPECPYCKQLEKTLAGMDDVTIYTFLYPVLGDRSATAAKKVWCSPDRASAWGEKMLSGVDGPGSDACDNPIARNMQLGRSLEITGTPTLIAADGRMQPGALPSERIAEFLAAGPKRTVK